MNQQSRHRKQKLKNNEGWVTIELLYSLPILMIMLILIIHFGWAMHYQQSLTFAVNAAVRQLAKTQECGQADAVFTQNFDRPVQNRVCDPRDDISTYGVEHTFTDIPLFMISTNPLILKASASTVTEKTK